MSRTDRERITDALEHLRVLHEHLERGDFGDQVVADAVSLRLASAIDSISACCDGVRTRVFGDDWNSASATRNRIAHGYAFVDIAIIQATVERDLPDIEAALRAELRTH